MSAGHRTTPRAKSLQIGEKFNRWTVIGPYEVRINGKANARRYYYPCECKCGTKKLVESCGLIYKKNQSCGCMKAEKTKARNTTHGQSRTALYGVWNAIIARCENPNSESYQNYGARGITMCREWREDYVAFRDWAMANGYKKGLTVERKDNDLGYSPSNCILANRTAQARNRRSSSLLTAFGETKTAAEWAEDPRCSVSQGLIHYRIKNGVDHLTAITAPPNCGRKFKKHKVSA